MSRFYQGDLMRMDAADPEADGAENGRSGREETGTEPASTSGSGAFCVLFWCEHELCCQPTAVS